MKVKVSSVNPVAWKEVTVRAKLPAKLDKLQEIAYNLWWVWNSDAKNIFRYIDNEAWHRAQSNPILLLNILSYDKMVQLLGEPEKQNLVLKGPDTVSVILIAGIGGMTLNFAHVTITEVACALILGILTNVMLSGKKKDETK